MPREKTKKEIILEAATRVFGTKGFYMANMIDIAEEAGIGKGTIYEYFKSKSSLFIETIKFNVDLYQRRMEQQVDSQKGFKDKLYMFMKTHWEVVRENVKSASVFMINPGDINLTDESIKVVFDFLIEARNDIAALLAGILELGCSEGKIRDIDVVFAADMLLDMISRCGMRGVLMDYSDMQFKQESEKLMDLFIHGAGLVQQIESG